MKKYVLSFLFFFVVLFTSHASGIKGAYSNADLLVTADVITKQQFTNALQLATLRSNLEQTLAKTPKLAISKRIALKSILNKVRKAEKKNSEYNVLLVTVGIILIIVGILFIVLSLVFSSTVTWGKAGLGGGSGLLVLGLILWLVGKFVDLPN